jgi:hypothetical protein
MKFAIHLRALSRGHLIEIFRVHTQSGTQETSISVLGMRA